MRESSALPRHHLRRFYCKLPAGSILPVLNYKLLLFNFEPTCGGHCAKVTPPFSAGIPLVLRALCKNRVCIYSECRGVSLNHQCLEKVLKPWWVFHKHLPGKKERCHKVTCQQRPCSLCSSHCTSFLTHTHSPPAGWEMYESVMLPAPCAVN